MKDCYDAWAHTVGSDSLLFAIGNLFDGTHSAQALEVLRDEGYGAYLETSWWINIRDLAHEGTYGCCEFCGWQSPWENLGGLHVHHLNYDNVGNEHPEDLIILCGNCHRDVHDFPKIAADVQRFAARRFQP